MYKPGEDELIAAVSTRNAKKRATELRGAQPKAKNTLSGNAEQPFEGISWSEKQSQDKDLSIVLKWLKDGKRDKTDVQISSPALRSYFMNFSQLKMKDDTIFRVWTVSEKVSRDLIVAPAELADKVSLVRN